MNKSLFAKKIIAWYEENKRSLPWRETKDPYKIWLSEVILQQTRVAQGLQYYHRFVEQYQTVKSLALAKEQDVLRLWQGLGYYTRARNLYKGARKVVDEYKGIFPNTFSELQKIPGIGSYTAAAIASFSFREKVAVVDGNVFRVLARTFGIDQDILSNQGKAIFSKLANELISHESPDLFNQAMMEFGALQCIPKNPPCEICIFKKQCFAYAHNLQSSLPVKNKKPKVRNRYFHYVVITRGKRLMMRQRGEKDIWQGLHDFYLIETAKPSDIGKLVKKHGALKKIKNSVWGASSNVYKHILSHQTLYASFIILELDAKSSPDQALPDPAVYKFYPLSKIAALPKPVLISRFLEDYGYLKK